MVIYMYSHNVPGIEANHDIMAHQKDFGIQSSGVVISAIATYFAQSFNKHARIAGKSPKALFRRYILTRLVELLSSNYHYVSRPPSRQALKNILSSAFKRGLACYRRDILT
ncbi:hypothetical protein [Pseudozobellia sp. WGM2]|uniref:hypothetical protein n=1 Tax=Pseudozobellia sp. WGM2 TaxID=2787625 RepID=UPI001AE05536|nr:hypothetical protein [Pseudozobellia sp. WGM2]